MLSSAVSGKHAISVSHGVIASSYMLECGDRSVQQWHYAWTRECVFSYFFPLLQSYTVQRIKPYYLVWYMYELLTIFYHFPEELRCYQPRHVPTWCIVTDMHVPFFLPQPWTPSCWCREMMSTTFDKPDPSTEPMFTGILYTILCPIQLQNSRPRKFAIYSQPRMTVHV